VISKDMEESPVGISASVGTVTSVPEFFEAIADVLSILKLFQSLVVSFVGFHVSRLQDAVLIVRLV
jgi:hypothetical protein